MFLIWQRQLRERWAPSVSFWQALSRRHFANLYQIMSGHIFKRRIALISLLLDHSVEFITFFRFNFVHRHSLDLTLTGLSYRELKPWIIELNWVLVPRETTWFLDLSELWIVIWSVSLHRVVGTTTDLLRSIVLIYLCHDVQTKRWEFRLPHHVATSALRRQGARALGSVWILCGNFLLWLCLTVVERASLHIFLSNRLPRCTFEWLDVEELLSLLL